VFRWAAGSKVARPRMIRPRLKTPDLYWQNFWFSELLDRNAIFSSGDIYPMNWEKRGVKRLSVCSLSSSFRNSSESPIFRTLALPLRD